LALYKAQRQALLGEYAILQLKIPAMQATHADLEKKIKDLEAKVAANKKKAENGKGAPKKK